jgi:hypothetical protein
LQRSDGLKREHGGVSLDRWSMCLACQLERCAGPSWGVSILRRVRMVAGGGGPCGGADKEVCGTTIDVSQTPCGAWQVDEELRSAVTSVRTKISEEE